MKVTPIRTERVTARSVGLFELIAGALPQLADGSVIAVTSKVVSLCEGSTVPIASTDKERLIEQESDYFTEPLGKYGFHFTITSNTLIPAAGIDESNSDDNFVLWPKDAQKTAAELWQRLRDHYGVDRVGVVITDSTCKPLRRGTVGIAMAHCGFAALKDYVGTPDLFGRPFRVSQASIAEGLAAAAVLAMGEGTEQTPLCVIEGAGFVDFCEQPPTAQELREVYIPVEEDIFAPLIQSVDWRRGQRGAGDGREA
jgi:putative folate metabolism gamma-glutamate ligase